MLADQGEAGGIFKTAMVRLLCNFLAKLLRFLANCYKDLQALLWALSQPLKSIMLLMHVGSPLTSPESPSTAETWCLIVTKVEQTDRMKLPSCSFIVISWPFSER